MVSLRGPARALLLVALLVGSFAALGTAPPGAAATGPSSPPVHGSVNGPSVVGTGTTTTFYINGTGGPAVSSNGSVIGTLSWKAKLSGPVLTGISVSPNSSTFSGSAPGVIHLKVAKITESITINVEITSSYLSTNATANVSYPVAIVVPYVVHAILVVGSGHSTLGFDVTVELDGAPVGTVSVPPIAANGSYNLTYDYATTGLSPGEHTFTISLANEHGLVTFPGGAVQYSQSFYVVGPPPDYTLYVLVGIVVFFGVLFILVTRVAARRRPAARK